MMKRNDNIDQENAYEDVHKEILEVNKRMVEYIASIDIWVNTVSQLLKEVLEREAKRDIENMTADSET